MDRGTQWSATETSSCPTPLHSLPEMPVAMSGKIKICADNSKLFWLVCHQGYPSPFSMLVTELPNGQENGN